MKETIYGVFAVRGDGATPFISELVGNMLFGSEKAALFAVGNLKLESGGDYKVHAIECEVK